jgi:hypothetical protein
MGKDEQDRDGKDQPKATQPTGAAESSRSQSRE